jgi:hypothetical protein
MFRIRSRAGRFGDSALRQRGAISTGTPAQGHAPKGDREFVDQDDLDCVGLLSLLPEDVPSCRTRRTRRPLGGHPPGRVVSCLGSRECDSVNAP